MKKSNKILLTGFLILLLIISAVHISLYAKYKSGDIVTVASHMEQPNKSNFAGVREVVLKDLGNVNLIVGDTASVGSLKDEQKDYTVSQQGSTLYVTGKDFPGHQTRARTALWITVPTGGTLTATNSLMDTEVDTKVTNGVLNVVLDASRLHVRKYRKTVSYDSLSVKAINESALEVQGATIRSINIHLNNSSVRETGNSLGAIQLAVDSTSEVSLAATNLIKAKITSTNHD